MHKDCKFVFKQRDLAFCSSFASSRLLASDCQRQLAVASEVNWNAGTTVEVAASVCPTGQGWMGWTQSFCRTIPDEMSNWAETFCDWRTGLGAFFQPFGY